MEGGTWGNHLVVLVLQLGLGALASAANGLRVVAVKGARGLGVVQRRPVLVVAGDEQGDAERATHDALLTVGRLAEAQGQVADGLGAALDAQTLVVVEGVRLALDAGVLDHGPGVSLQPRHGAPDVAVDLDDLLDGGGLEEGRRHSLLDAQDNTLRCGDADGGAAKLDGFEGVLDLEEAAFGGEGAWGVLAWARGAGGGGQLSVVDESGDGRRWEGAAIGRLSVVEWEGCKPT